MTFYPYQLSINVSPTDYDDDAERYRSHWLMRLIGCLWMNYRCTSLLLQNESYHLANADGNDVHMTGMEKTKQKKKKKTKKDKKDELDNLKREVEMVSR